MTPSVSNPAELVRLFAATQPDSWDRGFNRFPMLPQVTLALVVLRQLGTNARLVSRQARVHRNDEDDYFAKKLWNDETDPGLMPLLDRIRNDWPDDRKQGLTEMSVHAVQVEHAGKTWTFDGWGNEDEDRILSCAAKAKDRQASGYAGVWSANSHTPLLETQIDKLAELAVVREAVALCEHYALQEDTISQSTPSRTTPRL